MDSAEQIFDVTAAGFEFAAIQVFQYQYHNNKLYREYCDLLNTDPSSITSLSRIPFLPIRFFKTHQVISGVQDHDLVFESSGTTGSVNSKHFVKDRKVYELSFLKCFRQYYGDIEGKCIIGLLPSYLERQHSSLVYMVNELINQSGHPGSGFYLYDTGKLVETLLLNEQNSQPTLLIGVTYALIDLAEKHSLSLKHTTIMETGGMKGRKEELSRDKVHEIIKKHLGLTVIHSEYGMTELLSQAYSHGEGIFNCPSWMKILIRAEDDPFDLIDAGQLSGGFARGAINIIDLANIHSCSFIATDDLGKLYNNGTFEIAGRMDNSDLRGCGLMII